MQKVAMNMTARNAGLSFRSPDDDDSHRTRYSELQQAFDFYNQRLFDGELPECLITFQRVTQDLFQGKFALSWFDRFSVQVEQQKDMAAVIDQWRETIDQAHQNAEPGLILKRCCQCHRRTVSNDNDLFVTAFENKPKRNKVKYQCRGVVLLSGGSPG